MATKEQLQLIIEAKDQASAAVKKLGSALKNIEKETKAANTSFLQAEVGFGKLKQAATIVGASLLGVGVGVAKIAGDFEQAEVAFSTMLGSAQKGQQVLGALANFAASTPFTLQGVQNSAKQLLAMGIETEKLLPTLKSLGDVAAGLSVPIDQIALAFGQVKAAGQLTGAELRQFVQAGVPLLSELAKQFEVTEAQVKKMVEQGKVGFADVEKAFTNMTGKGGAFFNLMDKQSQTFLGQVSNMKDQLSLLAKEFGDAILPTLTSGLKAILKWIQDNRDKILEWKVAVKAAVMITADFIGALAKLGDIASKVRQRVEEFRVTLLQTVPFGSVFSGAVDQSSDSLQGLLMRAEQTKERIKILNSEIERGGTTYGPTNKQLQEAVANVKKIEVASGPAGESFSDAAKKMSDSAVELAENIQQAFMEAQNRIKSLNDELNSAVLEQAQSIQSAEEQLAEAFVKAQDEVKALNDKIAKESDVEILKNLQNELALKQQELAGFATIEMTLIGEISAARQKADNSDLQNALLNFQQKIQKINQEFSVKQEKIKKEIELEQQKEKEILAIQESAHKITEEFTLKQEQATVESIQRQIDAYNALAKAISNSKQGVSTPALNLATGLPKFAKGGVVPGKIGEPVAAIVHGGETIIPPGKNASSVAGGVNISVKVTGNQISNQLDLRDLALEIGEQIFREFKMTKAKQGIV